MRTRATFVLLAVLLACGTFWVSGCLLEQPTGTVRVTITDKPFPFEYIEWAMVTITRVDVRAAAGDDEGEEDAEDDDGAWITIWEPAEGEEGAEFNLVELRNGKIDLLTEAEIPADTYTQIRLFVTEGEVKVVGVDEPFDLTVPSGASSGLKLRVTFEVFEDQTTDLLVDFDLSRAFRPVPGFADIDDPSQIEEFHFSPTLGVRAVDTSTVGNISGLVTDEVGTPMGNVAVTAYDDQGVEVTSTATEDEDDAEAAETEEAGEEDGEEAEDEDEVGTYQLTGLPPGTYTVEFSADGYDDVQVSGVVVEAGADTTGVDAVMTESVVVPVE